jgi:predicted DNA-binding protein (UPF0251 family)/predicted Fe-Mo cluster-binding NifX family protein
MGRCKKQRAYSIKPKIKSFAPTDNITYGAISLDHDELESIFLMDFQDMYQEDAAKLMNVSRPTLSRIIKSARHKIATAIIQGANLNISDEKRDFKVAICLPQQNDFSSCAPKENLIAVVELQDNTLSDISYYENPIVSKGEKPSRVLPPLLKELDVNFFVTSMIGEGLKNSLLANGIFVKEIHSLTSFEELRKLFE